MSNHAPVPWSELDQLVTIYNWLMPYEKEDISKRFPEIMNAVWDTVFALLHSDVESPSNYPITDQLRFLRNTDLEYARQIIELYLTNDYE